MAVEVIGPYDKWTTTNHDKAYPNTTIPQLMSYRPNSGHSAPTQAERRRTHPRMLRWWRTMTSRARQIPHNLPVATGSGSGANPAYSPSSVAATSEEPATHRVIHSISPKTTSIARANHGKTTSTAPSEVATPLPPRPRRNGEIT